MNLRNVTLVAVLLAAAAMADPMWSALGVSAGLALGRRG